MKTWLCFMYASQVKIWFQNHRYKCKRQAKEKAMAEQNAQNQVITQIPKSCVNRFESETFVEYNITNFTKTHHFDDFYYV